MHACYFALWWKIIGMQYKISQEKVHVKTEWTTIYNEFRTISAIMSVILFGSFSNVAREFILPISQTSSIIEATPN